MDQIPQIKTVMTPFPYSVPSEASVADAIRMMAEHDIRHLPVCNGDDLVGIVSDRDIKRALDPELGLPPKENLLVRQVMISDPFVVDLKTPLDNVLVELARKLGVPVADLLRRGESEFKDATDLPETGDDAALAAWIAEHPIVLERPIVVAGDKAVIGRPPENVEALLG